VLKEFGSQFTLGLVHSSPGGGCAGNRRRGGLCSHTLLFIMQMEHVPHQWCQWRVGGSSSRPP